MVQNRSWPYIYTYIIPIHAYHTIHHHSSSIHYTHILVYIPLVQCPYNPCIHYIHVPSWQSMRSLHTHTIHAFIMHTMIHTIPWNVIIIIYGEWNVNMCFLNECSRVRRQAEKLQLFVRFKIFYPLHIHIISIDIRQIEKHENIVCLIFCILTESPLGI